VSLLFPTFPLLFLLFHLADVDAYDQLAISEFVAIDSLREIIHMRLTKTLGVKVILIGIFLQLVSFVFVSGYDSERTILGNLKRMELVFKRGFTDQDRAQALYFLEQEPIVPPPPPVSYFGEDNTIAMEEYAASLKEVEEERKKIEREIDRIKSMPTKIRFALPYSHFYILDICLIFGGIWLVLFGRSAEGKTPPVTGRKAEITPSGPSTVSSEESSCDKPYPIPVCGIGQVNMDEVTLEQYEQTQDQNIIRCLNCGYSRTNKDDDFISKDKCPKCGIYYKKTAAVQAEPLVSQQGLTIDVVSKEKTFTTTSYTPTGGTHDLDRKPTIPCPNNIDAELEQTIRNKSTDLLISMVKFERNNYTQDAIGIGEDELKKRIIDLESSANMAFVREMQKASAAEKAYQSGPPKRIALYAVVLSIFFLIQAQIIRSLYGEVRILSSVALSLIVIYLTYRIHGMFRSIKSIDSKEREIPIDYKGVKVWSWLNLLICYLMIIVPLGVIVTCGLFFGQISDMKEMNGPNQLSDLKALLTGGRVCLDREQGFISGNLLCLEFMLHPVSALES